MLSRVFRPIFSMVAQNGAKNFTTTTQNKYKVTIIGAAGGIGQPIALLLKMHPLVTHVSCYDISKSMVGIAADLSHANTPVKVTGHIGPENLDEALRCAHVVVIPAGVPRTVNMTRDDLFGVTAPIIYEVGRSICRSCPTTMINIVTNPVNSLVPLMAEILKEHGCYDPRRLVGVTTLDVVRAQTFCSEALPYDVDPRCVTVPVIGGHSVGTIIPVLSQCDPPLNIRSQHKIEALTKRIEDGGAEIVKLKANAGGGSATLTMAYAAVRQIDACLKGLHGEPNVIECAYIRSDITDATYFANPVLFGKCGVEYNLGFGCLNEYECSLVLNAIKILKKNIKKGEDFFKSKKNKN